jgi:anaerobic magnesium-protoporphyrin IX monomethyl ester cyclase
MADILMTHSYHLAYDAKQARKMQPYIPLATLYAATALRERGFSVAVFDTMLRAPDEGFVQMLREQRPKLVVVYEDDFNFLSKMCLTRMREVAHSIAQAARAAGAVAVVHGSDATDHPELFFESGFAYVLCGEAELTLVALCEAVLHGNQPPALDGLLRAGDRGRASVQRLAKNPAWAHLPLPARELVDLDAYRTAWHGAHGYFSTNLVASRGCPFQCNWCAKPVSESRFQLRSAASVAEEMALLKAQGAEHLWFSDDVFALNRHWVKELAYEVMARDAAVPFKIQSRADLMHTDTVQHLQRAGCTEVWMGVESGAQSVLDAMQKGITLAQVEGARERLGEAGIQACFFLQFGYPGETWAELQQTIALVRRLRPDEIGISFAYPLPGTVFHDRVQAELGAKRNWAESDDLCIMFNAAYTSEFYRAVREALHAEVESWKVSSPAASLRVAELWDRVWQMEPEHRVEDALVFTTPASLPHGSALVPVEQLLSSGKL